MKQLSSVEIDYQALQQRKSEVLESHDNPRAEFMVCKDALVRLIEEVHALREQVAERRECYAECGRVLVQCALDEELRLAEAAYQEYLSVYDAAKQRYDEVTANTIRREESQVTSAYYDADNNRAERVV